MVYQLVSSKEIVARIENDFDIDHADWITRAPLWIADAMDRLQFISSYEDKKITLTVENYTVILPDDAPQDIRRILGIEYNGLLIRRLNVINPIKQPQVNSEYSSVETYSIKNGYIITSFEEGDIVLYYQTPALEWDINNQVYWPKVPANSIIQGAIEWYLFMCMLRRGYKHPTYSLESRNPLTNPALMWEKEQKAARNQGGAFDSEDRAEFSRIMRTFAIDVDTPINTTYREEDSTLLSDSITGQVGIV